MQKYTKIQITKDEVISTAEKMKKDGVVLSMIHGFIGDDGLPVISYEYDVDGGIMSYTVEGEKVLPTISHIYDLAAQWPEREIHELMDMTFEGLDTSKRLFMPDNMLDGQGQILVTPMDKLIEKARKQKED